MGVLLIVAAIVLLYLIVLRPKVAKGIRVCVLCVVVISAAGLLFGYYYPRPVMLPENPVYMYRLGIIEPVTVNDEQTTEQITAVLEQTTVQRVRDIADIHTPAQADDWLYIWVYDGDRIEYGIPTRVMEFTFIVSDSNRATLEIFEKEMSKSYRILDAQALLDKLPVLQ